MSGPDSDSDPDRPHLVVLSGAGISAESGLPTFRGAGGLWEGHAVTEVATPEAWGRDRALVLRFYNERRRQLPGVEPNDAHRALARVESEGRANVSIITQNVDDLHERAGSNNILHLHGELLKSRSTLDPRLVYDTDGADINIGDKCERGSQLRPHIVWFGEAVPLLETAAAIAARADILIIVGTSLAVYPAAGLVHDVPAGAPVYLVDPGAPAMALPDRPDLTVIAEPAGQALPPLLERLLPRLK